jgi:hypothetical protein
LASLEDKMIKKKVEEEEEKQRLQFVACVVLIW